MRFADLALAVVDEQHRFGVHQRLELAAKGACTDLLVMTATLIPRTLVLALYGDMAVSELHEKPPGRPPIRTRALPLARLDEITAAVRRALERVTSCGGCARRSPPRRTTAPRPSSATRCCAHYGAVVGLVHGRMAGADKDRAMRDFACGKVRLLVATTVIEVGVDVPAAGVMVIEHAERFGLAQLHQLRGRVGRGARASSCLLLYGEPLTAARARGSKCCARPTTAFASPRRTCGCAARERCSARARAGCPRCAWPTWRLMPTCSRRRARMRRILRFDPALDSARGRALRGLLRLFERHGAIAYLGSGSSSARRPFVAAGPTIPPEMTILMPSSIDMSSGIRSLLGTNSRKPDVGLGVVGRNTLTISSSERAWISPRVGPVTKPMAAMPRRGYSTRTTSAERARLLGEHRLEDLLERAVHAPHDGHAREEPLAQPHQGAAGQTGGEHSDQGEECEHDQQAQPAG